MIATYYLFLFCRFCVWLLGCLVVYLPVFSCSFATRHGQTQNLDLEFDERRAPSLYRTHTQYSCCRLLLVCCSSFEPTLIFRITCNLIPFLISSHLSQLESTHSACPSWAVYINCILYVVHTIGITYLSIYSPTCRA